MIRFSINFEKTEKRYLLPRTAYTLLGSVYFFFTFEFKLFAKCLAAELLCFALVYQAIPQLGLTGFFLPRVVVPFIMHRFPALDDLEGALQADWFAPIINAIGMASKLAMIIFKILHYIFA